MVYYTAAIKTAISVLPQLKYLEFGVDTGCYNMHTGNIALEQKKVYRAFDEFAMFEKGARTFIQESAWVVDTLMMHLPCQEPLATAISLKRR